MIRVIAAPWLLCFLANLVTGQENTPPPCGRYVPGSPEYELLRKPYNSAVPDSDSWPTVIWLVCSQQDVVTALKEAFRLPARISVRGGGHHIEGYSSYAPKNAGQPRVLIDTYWMNSIFINSDNGHVRVQAGVKVTQLNQFLASQVQPLTVPMTICGTVGVIGSALGGGYGVTSRVYGLTADNIVSVSIVVLRNGGEPELLEVRDSGELADLFWALRGAGGGNFGVVTEIVLRTWPIPPVVNYFEGNVDYAKARELVEYAVQSPQQLFYSIKVDAGEVPLRVAQGLYLGTDPAVIAKLKSFGINDIQLFKPNQAREWQRLIAGCKTEDACTNGYKAVPYFTKPAFKRKAIFVHTLDEAVSLVDLMRKETNDVDFIDLTSFNGYIAQPKDNDTAFVHREALFLVMMFKFWDSKANTDPAPLNAGMTAFHNRVRKIVAKTAGYPNFIDRDHINDDWMEIFYGRNADRLREVKAKYDPCNHFSFPMSIAPAGGVSTTEGQCEPAAKPVDNATKGSMTILANHYSVVLVALLALVHCVVDICR